MGQDHITQTLRNAIEQDRIAHAYLFVGPRGTGKTTTARIVAKALNCTDGPNADFDPNDPICQEIADGRCMDVLEIDGASNNNVDQIRELRDNVRFAPTRGKYKVYIIDEVHMLTSQAFNALLKTLEEPPEHVKFIFATTEPQKVLPTILSRCQRFDLRRIPANLIADHLQYISGLEKITLEAAAAQAIAKGAEGGLRDAESMLDQLVAFCGDHISETDVLAVFGFTGQQTVADLCGAILSTSTAAALEIIHDQNEAGKDLMKLLGDLIGYLRNLLISQVDPTGVDTEIPADVREAMESHATHISPTKLLGLIDQFAATEGRMKWAPNKKLHLEIAIIKAVQTLDETTLTDVISALKTISEGGVPKVSTPKSSLTYKAIAKKPDPATMERAAAKRSFPKSTPAPAKTPAAPASPPVAAAPTEPKEQPTSPKPPQPSTPSPTPSPTTPTTSLVAAQPGMASTREATPTPPVVKSSPAVEKSAVVEQPPAAVSVTGSQTAESTPAPPEAAATPPQEEPIPAIAPVATPEPAASDPTLDGHKIWTEVQHSLREKTFLHAYLIKGEFLEINGRTFLVGFSPGEFLACRSLMEDDKRLQVENALNEIGGTQFQFKCETREGLKITTIQEADLETEVDPLEEFKNDPLIKQALEIFKGELELTP